MDAVPLRRIVVGVNGSAPSLAALRWAAGEARLRRAGLHVVHVWDRTRQQLAPYATLGGRLTPAQDRTAARTRLAVALRAAFGLETPTGITTELAEGLVARVLLDRAADADLLVLGATSFISQAGSTAGPVARACLGHAHCPVVIVSAAESGPDTAGPRGPGDAALLTGGQQAGRSRMSVKDRRRAPAEGGP
jgi:nucleotide-binding universal stress UspA family protein